MVGHRSVYESHILGIAKTPSMRVRLGVDLESLGSGEARRVRFPRMRLYWQVAVRRLRRLQRRR